MNAVAAPALPASDLERLDEVKVRDRPIAVAPPNTPGPPTAGVLLLGTLAALSLIGVRRRRPFGEST